MDFIDSLTFLRYLYIASLGITLWHNHRTLGRSSKRTVVDKLNTRSGCATAALGIALLQGDQALEKDILSQGRDTLVHPRATTVGFARHTRARTSERAPNFSPIFPAWR
jgi:hypothetical protein